MSEVAFLVVTAFVAGVGAWFGSYLREKARNYATREDIQQLTSLTESVKSEISGKLWLDQKRWDLRRDFYWQLLGVLSELNVMMQRYRGLLPERVTDLREVDQLMEEAKSTTPGFVEKTTQLTYLLGIGRIILPQPVVVTLDEFDRRLRDMERETKSLAHKILGEVSPENLPGKNPDEIINQFESQYGKMRLLAQQSVDDFINECERVTRLVVQAAREDLLSLEGGAH